LSPHRVVVTGMGFVSALGFGPEDHSRGLRTGRSAAGPIRRFETTGFRTAQGAEVDEDRLERELRRLGAGASLRRMGIDARMLLWSTATALRESGYASGRPLPVVVGTTLEGFWQGEQWYAQRRGRGLDHARPSFLTSFMAGSQLAGVAEALGVPLEPTVVSNACATGVSAIGRLYRRIRAGACEAGLAGGYDTLTRFIQLGFDSLGALTPKTCSPFDRARSGFFLGDAAALLLLEDLGSARRRGARIVGEIVGYGEALDAYHPTHPDPQGRGIARAIRQALEEGGLRPEDLDYVNAHGTATPANDAAEARGILDALGEAGKTVPVSSTKALVGHTLGAAGALEQCFCLLAMGEGFLPVQAGLVEADPACPLDFVRAPEGRPRLALNNSLGFGGANGALIARRWEEAAP
jgi:3-oxoacyl-[acyl-carrier-protein] synthase II